MTDIVELNKHRRDYIHWSVPMFQVTRTIVWLSKGHNWFSVHWSQASQVSQHFFHLLYDNCSFLEY